MAGRKERSSRKGRGEAPTLPTNRETPGLPRRATGAAIAAGVALAVIVVYAGAFSFEFVAFDDVEAIVARPEYNPPTLAALPRLWGVNYYGGLYTPLLWVGWWALAFLARADDGSWSAAPYHAFNVFAHAAAAALAFLVLRRLLRDGDRDGGNWSAAVGALAFALHPLQVESVAWVSGMKTPLSGLLALWASWHYLAFADRVTLRRVATANGAPSTEPHAPPASAAKAAAHAIAGSLLFLLALLAKPTVVVIPLVLAVFDRTLRCRPWRTIAIGLAPWLAMAVACSLLNASMQSAAVVSSLSLGRRALISMDSAGFYVRKTLFPFPLVPDYARTPEWVAGSAALRFGWVWVVPALVLAAAHRRRAPWVAAGIVAFFLGAASTFGLKAFDYQVYSTVADRYAYLSLVGIALIAACATRAAAGRWGAARAYAVAALLLIVWGGMTMAQVTTWRDTRTLAAHTLRYSPSSLAAFRSLAFNAARRGDGNGVVEAVRSGLAARPGDPVLLQWAGNVALAQQRPTDAAAAFREALTRARVGREQLLMGLGTALAQSQQFDEAERAFRDAIAADPAFAPAHENLGVMYAQRGQWLAAETEFTAALQLDPTLQTSKAGLETARARRPGP